MGSGRRLGANPYGRGGGGVRVACALRLLAVLAVLALALGFAPGALAAGTGEITGTVENAVGNTAHGPIEGIEVCAYPTSVEELNAEDFGCATTNVSGKYTIAGLESGEYEVGFFSPFGGSLDYVTQYYNDKSSASEATPVSVTAPATSAGIDAAMQTVGAPPVNTTAPVVSGTPAVGGTLTCAPGLWAGAPAPAFSYQWLRGGAPIAGANAAGYTVQSADAATSLSCRVTAKNTKGERSATSASLTIGALPVVPPARVTTPKPTPTPTPKVMIAGSKLAVTGKSVRASIVCSGAACEGTVELTVRVVAKHRKGKRTVSRRKTLVLAKGSYSLAAGQTGTVVLRLTAAGKRRLAHAKRHPISAKLTVSVRGGETITMPVLAGVRRGRGKTSRSNR
ncbi:MAG: hypothetical protein ACRDK7_01045 [Solirubrobacteraceae bacterium]